MSISNVLEVFLGVITSFLLWFGGEKWFQYQRNKKARNNMVREIQEEIGLNITLLDSLIQSIPEAWGSGNVPLYIPGRLRLSVYEYMVSSGEIRLLGDFRKQRLIRLAAFTSDSFNEFIKNTEMLLAIFNLKPREEALKLAKHRLANLVEMAKDKRERLQDTLNQLQLGELSKEGDKFKGTDISS